MRNSITSLVVAALMAAGPSASLAQSDEGSIRRAFLAYKTAILEQHGPAAVVIVNGATLQYYAQMKALALEGRETEVRGLTPMNKAMVLTLRHRIPVADLRSMTPEHLFTHAVNQVGSARTACSTVRWASCRSSATTPVLSS